MATVGSLVVPVSADIQGLKKGLKDAGREVKGFAKSFAVIEKLGAGGLAGLAFGGGLGGLVGQQLDDVLGISDKIKEFSTHVGQGIFQGISGVNEQRTAEAEGQLAKEAELSKAFGKKEQALKLEYILLTQGKEAMERAKLAMDGYSQAQINAAMAGEKVNQVLRDQAAAEQAAQRERDQINRKQAQALDVIYQEKERLGMGDIDRQIFDLKKLGIGQKELDIARKDLEDIKAANDRADAARIIAGDIRAAFGGGNIGKMFGDDLNAQMAKNVPALLKDSAEEFSAMQKLRRELRKEAAERDNREIEKNQAQQIDIEKEILKVAEKMRALLKDPPIKQVKFN